MSEIATKTYQDLLQEFSKTPKEDVKAFTEKYKEVLTEFLNLNEVYTIADKNAKVSDVKNNTARPLCALSNKKLPCMWFFSEREMAEKFVNHFGLIKDDVEYIMKLQGEQIIGTVKKAIFNGVFQFAIDEGKCSMVIVPYDLLNRYLENKGEEKFLLARQYELMILFSSMKFGKKSVFAIESDEKLENGIIVPAIDRDGVLRIFEKQEDADVHKYDIGYGRKESKGLNIIELRNSINEISEEVEVVKIEIKENVFEISSKKLAYILNEMTKINQ